MVGLVLQADSASIAAASPIISPPFPLPSIQFASNRRFYLSYFVQREGAEQGVGSSVLVEYLTNEDRTLGLRETARLIYKAGAQDADSSTRTSRLAPGLKLRQSPLCVAGPARIQPQRGAGALWPRRWLAVYFSWRRRWLW